MRKYGNDCMIAIQVNFGGLALIDMDGTLLQSRTIDALSNKFKKKDFLKELDKRSLKMPAYKVSQEIAKFFKCNTKEEIKKVFDTVPITSDAQN